jgi:hypothetical protein
MRLRKLGNDVPSWLWLWLPLAVVVVALAVKVLDDGVYLRWIIGEYGLVENLTLLALAVATVYGIRIVLMRTLYPAPEWVRWWVLLITLGSVFFLGEEASWGQHLFNWSPSDRWSDLNLQQETNLHNIAGFGFLFDQLPRNLLTASALVGGIIVPLYRRARRLAWTQNQVHYWLWPTLACLPAALGGVFASVPQKLYKTMGAPLPDLLVGLNPGELKECFLAFFIMLYLASLTVRISQAEKTPSFN